MPTPEMMAKLEKLDRISIKAERAMKEHPENVVARDLRWLVNELRQSWLELEKRNDPH